jgi:signal transduction histidine kinase
MLATTIFHTTITETDRLCLERVAPTYGAQLVRVHSASLAKHALAAAARGAVLFIAHNDREAGQALSFGIDETLRAGEITVELLSSAIERAQTRAIARSSPEYLQALLDQDDDVAFATLGATLCERLENPLTLAAADCAAITQALNCLVDIDDQFVAWTALVAPPEQLRNLVARRLTVPTSPELKEVLKRLRVSIGRAESLVRLMRNLTGPTDVKDRVTVGPLLMDVADVMRQLISPWADVSIHADATCVAATSRTTLVVIFGTLLARAIDSIRMTGRGKGTIEVRVFEEEAAVIIEIRDDGREILSDLRPKLLDDPPSSRASLLGIRDRARRAGGDLLVDSDGSGTTVRVFLPSVTAPSSQDHPTPTPTDDLVVPSKLSS